MKDQLLEIIQENRNELIIGAIALIAVATQWEAIQQKIGNDRAVAESQRVAQLATQKLEAEKLVREQQREIANARYDGGCEVIQSVLLRGKATTIKEGEPILNGVYAELYRKNPKTPANPNHYIGAGVDVCDVYGVTGITQFDPSKGYAVVQSVATTNDRNRMRKALERSKGLERPSLGNLK